MKRVILTPPNSIIYQDVPENTKMIVRDDLSFEKEIAGVVKQSMNNWYVESQKDGTAIKFTNKNIAFFDSFRKLYIALDSEGYQIFVNEKEIVNETK